MMVDTDAAAALKNDAQQTANAAAAAVAAATLSAQPNLPFKPRPPARTQELNANAARLNQQQNAQTRQHESHRPRILVAKQVPEDHFGRDGVYVAPGAKTIPLTLVRPDANVGPRRSSSGEFLEHTVLGDVDDFAEFEKIYSKQGHPEDEQDGKNQAEDVVTIEAPTVDEKHTRITFHSQQQTDGVTDKSEEERREWLNRLHIFQRYREIREEHALSNWKRHSVEWSRVEDDIARRINKPVDELLMARLNEYRRFIEERDLIEEALLLLEEHKVNFWKTGLRIGNDLLGLCFQMPRGGPRQIERLRSSEAIMSRLPKKQSEYQMARMNELRHVILHLDPFYGHDDSGYLEIVGHGISRTHNEDLTREYMQRLDKRALSESLSMRSRTASVENNSNKGVKFDEPLSTSLSESHAQKSKQTSESMPGTHLVFSTKRMFFQVLLDEVSTSVLTIHNRGTVAVYFEWEPVVRPNPLKVKSIYDGVQRFFMSHTRGVILPGTAYDFPIIFKSASPGLFTEQWRLATSPAMPHQPDLSVTLQGLAIEEDVYFERRAQIEKMLDKRHAEAVARETIELILRNIKSSKRRPDRIIDSNQAQFESANKDLNLRFRPDVFDSMIELADATYRLIETPNKVWDRSVASLHESITLIPQADVRASHIGRLNQLVQMSSEANAISRSSVLYSICYDIFIEMASKISETSDTMRKRFGLPLSRAAAKFFETDDGQEDNADQQSEAAKQASVVADAAKKQGVPNVAPSTTNPPDPKKPAPAPAAPSAAKDAKKGATVVPPVKPVEPNKKAVPPPKRPNELSQDSDDVSHSISAPKTLIKKRFDSAKSWSQDRRAVEIRYSTEFRSAVHEIVEKSILRLIGLFDDVSGPRRS